jgi:TRAP-type C4-dicarboxylate transport system permease small subunit
LVILTVIAGVIVIDILGRWLADSPIIGLADFVQLAVAIVMASCFPAGVLLRQHVAIQLIGQRIGTRTTAWLDAFGAFVLFLVLAGIGWQLVVYTIEMVQENQKTWILGLYFAPWWTVASTLMVITALLQGLVFVGQALRAFHPRAVKP